MRVPTLCLFAFLLGGGRAVSAESARTYEVPGFVGSAACASCHAAESHAWSGSHHSWALKAPTRESVLGDFADTTFEHKGVTSRFFQKNGRYFVETDGADGRLATFEVKYSIGVSPLQQYLVELAGGRLQALDLAWDVVNKRWFHLYPNEDVAAGDGLHWTGPYKNWQARCAVCHQTDFRKNYDPIAHSYRSTWSDLTVGCEACHGPGEAHVAWSERHVSPDPNLAPHGWVPTSAPGKQAELNVCGSCHALREALSADSMLSADPLGDHYKLSYLRNGAYFSDGQQEAEVYVLSSFLQSKMHEKGVTCTNCHDPHSGQLVAQGNAICTQCHNEVGRSEFPTLPRAAYDTAAHHHHAPGTAASLCVNCHMPERSYMVVDARRDHYFRIPDPLLSHNVGSPSACLSCHSGKSAQWAADAIGTWAPARKPLATIYGEAFAAARRDGLDRATIDNLVQIAADPSETAIVRASAIAEIGGQADPATAARLSALLTDESDLVRRAAVQLWRSTPVGERAAKLFPLIDDDIASVRLAVALELSSVPLDGLPVDQRGRLERALEDLRASMLANADFPEGQMAIGGLAMTTRNWAAATHAFAEAAFLDPQLVDAWLAQARIAAALGDTDGAISVLMTAYQKNAGNAAVAFDLAQLLIQQGRLPEAAAPLASALSVNPGSLDLRVTLALVLLRQNELAGAKAQINALLAAAPQQADGLMLLGLWQIASGDVAAARETVREIQRLYPGVQLPEPLQALSQTP